jgi:hypothetical protein
MNNGEKAHAYAWVLVTKDIFDAGLAFAARAGDLSEPITVQESETTYWHWSVNFGSSRPIAGREVRPEQTSYVLVDDLYQAVR